MPALHLIGGPLDGHVEPKVPGDLPRHICPKAVARKYKCHDLTYQLEGLPDGPLTVWVLDHVHAPLSGNCGIYTKADDGKYYHQDHPAVPKAA